VFQKPEDTPFDIELPRTGLCLALDGLQDPGNVGTILRLADWFGIEHIVCSHDTADIYSPKVVQASMGAICRVKVCKANLVEALENMPSDIPLYGTFLDGENIHRQALTDYGIIVMGNEGNGIRPEIEKNITRRLFIPNYPEGRPTSESLNVAIATAIVCAEFRHRTVVAPSGNPQ
jgi:TrmH family RNA methyltransferase